MASTYSSRRSVSFLIASCLAVASVSAAAFYPPTFGVFFAAVAGLSVAVCVWAFEPALKALRRVVASFARTSAFGAVLARMSASVRTILARLRREGDGVSRPLLSPTWRQCAST